MKGIFVSGGPANAGAQDSLKNLDSGSSPE
jgi:hypothetical protein